MPITRMSLVAVEGLVVGGAPAQRTHLVDARFLVVDERGLERAPWKEVRTLTGRERGHAAASSEALRYGVFVLDHAAPEVVRIGRTAPCDVLLKAPSVSATHARMERVRGGDHLLYDEGSSNGTSVAEVELARDGRGLPLRPNTSLRFGMVDAHYFDLRELLAFVERIAAREA